jgi:hypothetical protein
VTRALAHPIGVMHLRNLDFTTVEILGVRDNPVCEIIYDTAEHEEGDCT